MNRLAAFLESIPLRYHAMCGANLGIGLGYAADGSLCLALAFFCIAALWLTLPRYYGVGR